MAVIKCKMCGGDLEIVEGSTVCECTYCGTKQTVPSADNEKKLTLFARAGRLLRACEFDKASGVFETIVADFPEEAEAYWGLVLCKYGIEYVDDPATGKKIPTCHRSSFDSVMKDANFEQACENTDAVARRVYRDEARAIEELRKSIIEVSDKEEPYDVFISYKEKDADGERTPDSVIAQEIYRELTREGYRVFFARISLESRLGTEYEPYIFAALNSAKVMIVVGTDYENFDAVWVKNEWSRFLKLIAKGERKTLIPVFKNMDAYDMPEEFNKLTALDMGKVGAIQDLVHGVEKIIGKKKESAQAQPVQQPTYVSNEADAKTAAAVKRGRLALEESDWLRAKDYFEQALTLDAECAEAYFGMALAENECRNAEDYIERAASQTPERKTLTISLAEEHIRDVVGKCEIPMFISTGTIKSYYNAFNPLYSSAADGQRAIREKEKKNFENNRNIVLAFRFAKGKYRETLENVRIALYSALEDNVRVAEQEEHEAARQKEEKYQEFLQKKDLEVEELYQKRLAERENVYLGLCKEFENANESYRCRRLKERFRSLGDYKDCKEYVKKCDSRIAELEEIERKERIERSRASQYDSYSVLCSDTVTETLDNLETAKAGFESLGEYRDAPARAQKCAERIEQIKKEEEAKVKAAAEEAERQRIEQEKAKTEKKKKDRKLFIAIVVPALLGLAVFLIVTKLIIPGNGYRNAMSLMEDGKYKEAITAFEALGNYSDSVQNVTDIKYDLAVEKYGKETVDSIRSLEVGDIFVFGSYEQDNKISNGKEDIEWIVLEKDKYGMSVLLISRYGLDRQLFNPNYRAISWDRSPLRGWLNETFFRAAFSEEEQAMIPKVTVNADKNPDYSTSPGDSTTDRVFLLSITEAEKYFSSKSARQCQGTAYCNAECMDKDNGNCVWWLRTPGSSDGTTAYIGTDGGIFSRGTDCFWFAVRPAIWVDLGE